jgi:hypothetical protein
MPRSEADRAEYEVIRERYSSDLDAEFALIFRLLRARKRRARKPTGAREPGRDKTPFSMPGARTDHRDAENPGDQASGD